MKNLILVFAFATSMSLLVSTLYMTKPSSRTFVKQDLSGSGTCNKNIIHVTHASYWKQYPAPITAPNSYDNSISKDFIGRNAIVWDSNASTFHTFNITAVSDANETSPATIEGDIPVIGYCHFTLDGTQACTTNLYLQPGDACKCGAAESPYVCVSGGQVCNDEGGPPCYNTSGTNLCAEAILGAGNVVTLPNGPVNTGTGLRGDLWMGGCNQNNYITCKNTMSTWTYGWAFKTQGLNCASN